MGRMTLFTFRMLHETVLGPCQHAVTPKRVALPVVVWLYNAVWHEIGHNEIGKVVRQLGGRGHSFECASDK
jgi:hypothetical protein